MPFTGQLRSNEIFSALFNMIISQEVFADNVKGTDLVDEARVDGSLFGDTKLYYSTDALASSAWGNDAEAANLLEIARPEPPQVQSIYLDTFRQIRLTVDNYLSKRAWGDEGAFSSFTSVMLGWLRNTKKIYDGTTYNAYIGTAEGEATKSDIEVRATDAKVLAEDIANVFTEMTDYTRDFNDYKQLRRYSEDEIKIIFNSKYINKIKNVDLPVIFDNAGLKATFSKKVLPARYFGTVNTVSKTTADAKTRALFETTVSSGTGAGHYFPGDLLPTGTPLVSSGNIVVPSYQEDDTIVAKIVTKLPPYMSAFEVGTSFFNPRSLTETHYLTFGHNTIVYLKAFPMITLKAAQA